MFIGKITKKVEDRGEKYASKKKMTTTRRDLSYILTLVVL